MRLMAVWNKNVFSSIPEKTTVIRRIYVRETGVFRHQDDPIEGPPETLQTITPVFY